jgi:hypothetical protein
MLMLDQHRFTARVWSSILRSWDRKSRRLVMCNSEFIRVPMISSGWRLTKGGVERAEICEFGVSNGTAG